MTISTLKRYTPSLRTFIMILTFAVIALGVENAWSSASLPRTTQAIYSWSNDQMRAHESYGTAKITFPSQRARAPYVHRVPISVIYRWDAQEIKVHMALFKALDWT